MLNWRMNVMGKHGIEGRTDNRDFEGPSVGRGPIIKVILIFPEFISKH